MAEFIYNDLTQKGMALFTKVNQGNYGYPLNLTRVAVGSGSLATGENPYLRESLINYEHDLTIIGFENNGGGQSTLTALIDNKNISTGFYALEFGVFAFDEEANEEILYSYLSASKPNWIAPFTVTAETNIVNFITVVGTTDNITVVLDESSAWVTLKEFQDLKDNLQFNKIDIPIQHNLGKYPKVMTFKVSNGYGYQNYGDSGFGDEGLNEEIYCKSTFLDKNTIQLSVNIEFADVPILKQISEKEFIFQFTDYSLFVSLLTN